MERTLKITMEDLVMTLKIADINIDVEFDRNNTANTAVIEIYNASKFSEDFKETGREILIEAGNGDTENIVFKGIYNNFDYFENNTDKKMVLHSSDSHTALFNTLINKKYLNTSYSSMLKLVASQVGLIVGEIQINKDVKFESYTIYKSLYDFMQEIEKNTGALVYIKEGALCAASINGETGSIEILKNMILQRNYIGNNRYKLIFNDLIGEIEANVILDIEGEKMVVDNGKHYSNSKTGEHFTEVEVMVYG